MKELIINRYLKMFEGLSLELKLELLSKLTDSLKKGVNKPKLDKKHLLNELYGAWKDTEEDMISTIYKSRTISDRNISFD